MKAIIVGCGRLGVELAYGLYKRGHELAIIDNVAAAFNNLPSDFHGRTIEGEALSQDVLLRAGIEKADALAAVTNSDALNAVVGRIAQQVFNVPHVVVRNYEPRCRVLYEAFGLQIISSTSWGAQRMEELLNTADMRTVFSAGNGEVDIIEFVVPGAWHGHQLKELASPGECLPISVTRAGRAVLPSDDFVLEKGDVVHLSATFNGMAAFRARLNLVQEA